MALDAHAQDPLSFAALGDSDVEDVPIDDEAPTVSVSAEAESPAAPGAARSGEPDPLQGATRSDTVASYGQLVPPPVYDDVASTPLSSGDATGKAPAANEPLASTGAGSAASRGGSSPGGAGPEIAPIDPGHTQANGNGRASSSAGGMGADGLFEGTYTSVCVPLLRITVTDPVKKVEPSVIPGMSGGYVTYKVASATDLPGFAHKESSVRRRFKDFVALADLLAATHRGYFIPPRPDKNPVEGQRASPEFVETRRQLLERYLQAIAIHPVLARSDAMRVFLEVEGPLGSNFQWQQLQPLSGSTLEGLARLPMQVFGSDRAIPNPSEAAQSTSRTSDLLRRFRELGTSMKSDHKRGAGMSLDENNLRGESSMVEDYQEVLAGASRKAEKLVKKLEDYGNVLGDLGLSFIKLAKFEDEDGGQTGVYTDAGAAAKHLSADSRRVGMAAVRLSRLSRSAVAQDMGALGTLHEELGLTPCILKALREREGQLLTVHSLQDDLEKKRKGISLLENEGSKVFGGDKGKSRKIMNLQNDVAALEASLTAAEAEYAKILERNKQELERWRATRASGFTSMLDHYGRVESAYAQRSLGVWLGVAEEFGAGEEVAKRLQAGESAMGGSPAAAASSGAVSAV